MHARRAAPDRARPGGRDRQAPLVGAADRGACRHEEPADAHAQAAATAAALRESGVDVDFAPVVDTPSSPNNFLGSRAFSRSRTWNARMAKAFVGGLQQNGIAATAKHFPGLGLAGGNTDNGQITINASKAKIEPGLLPFQAAIKAGVKLVMVNTAIYPHLDASRKPAAFSRKIINGILRQQLGFTGVTVTDSLTAPAPDAIPHAATKAMLAGSDLLIWGAESAAERGYATLVADAPGSSALRTRLAQASGRIRALKTWLTAHGGPSCGYSGGPVAGASARSGPRWGALGDREARTPGALDSGCYRARLRTTASPRASASARHSCCLTTIPPRGRGARASRRRGATSAAP